MSNPHKTVYYKTMSGTVLATIPDDQTLQVSDSSRNISIDNDRKLSIRESDHESKRGTEPSAKYQYTEDDLGELKDFESLPLNDQLESIKCSSKRLKTIRSALNKPKEEFFNLITRKDLKKNLDFIIKVLENSLADEKKQVISRIQSDDDALSEIEPELVSSEVRNWLSMTFTRTASNLKKRKDNEKPKFKNVAHAIRAGIMVDRMLRRMSSSLESTVPVQVSTILKTLNNWNFEVFQMNEVSDGQALRHIGFELMQKFNILSKFKIQNLVMQNFLEAVEAGYSKYKNPYHNLVHAADVLQTLYNILNNAGLMNWLTSIEIFAVFISAIVHDFEHTGTTNNFHMQTRSDIALIYNDRAVLENYHISTTFRLMKNDSYNILQELSREEYKEFRNLCIEMILATDMSYHFSQLKTIKTMINLNEPVDKPKALSLILHCADISHPSKTWHLHEQWTNSLVEEFFAQGDKEKELGLPFSPLCDRNNTPIAQSQIGFINFIVEPSLAVMGDMIDKLLEQLLAEGESTKSNDSKENEKRLVARPWSPFLSENKAKWQALAEAEKLKKEEEEKKKETDNKIEEKS